MWQILSSSHREDEGKINSEVGARWLKFAQAAAGPGPGGRRSPDTPSRGRGEPSGGKPSAGKPRPPLPCEASGAAPAPGSTSTTPGGAAPAPRPGWPRAPGPASPVSRSLTGPFRRAPGLDMAPAGAPPPLLRQGLGGGANGAGPGAQGSGGRRRRRRRRRGPDVPSVAMSGAGAAEEERSLPRFPPLPSASPPPGPSTTKPGRSRTDGRAGGELGSSALPPSLPPAPGRPCPPPAPRLGSAWRGKGVRWRRRPGAAGRGGMAVS